MDPSCKMGRIHPRSRPPDTSPFGISFVYFLFISCFLGLVTAQSTTSSASLAAISNAPTINIPGIPSLVTLPPLNSSSPLLRLALPSSSNLYLTFSICSLSSNTSVLPTGFVSTVNPPVWAIGGGRPIQDLSSGGTSSGGSNLKNRQQNTWLLTWDLGFANWTTTSGGSTVNVLLGLGLGTQGDLTGLSSQGNVQIQVGISTSSPLSSWSSLTPYIGDTTDTTALIFTPLLVALPHAQPTYPNYTLPPADNSLPQAAFSAGSAPTGAVNQNFSLIVVPTGSSPTLDGLDHSICAVRSSNSSTGNIASTSNMIVNLTTASWMAVGNVEGYRSYWVLGGLLSEGNYTAWILNGATGELSSPVYFATKQTGFPCPIMLPTSICPSVGYAAAIEPNSTALAPLFELPSVLSSNITSSLAAFSVSLLAQACGRDFYSHVSSCADCYASYRNWLCHIALPRCADPSVTSSYPPPSTISRTPSNPRNANLPNPSYSYTELLPCLSVCNNADRTCPVNLQFRCPIKGVTANQTYGYVLENEDDAALGDGGPTSNWPAVDQWGNRWCSG